MNVTEVGGIFFSISWRSVLNPMAASWRGDRDSFQLFIKVFSPQSESSSHGFIVTSEKNQT